MPKLVISYRRADTPGMAGRIYDQLMEHFGRDSIFMDIDTIPFGVDFRQHISQALGHCDVLLALIGEKWLDLRQDGKRHLDDPADFVRIEIEMALKRGIPVIPVLLGQAQMPREDELPVPLGNLAYRNAIQVDVGRDFHIHMDRLIRHLNHLPLIDSLPSINQENVPDHQAAQTERSESESDRFAGSDACRRHYFIGGMCDRCGAWDDGWNTGDRAEDDEQSDCE